MALKYDTYDYSISVCVLYFSSIIRDVDGVFKSLLCGNLFNHNNVIYGLYYDYRSVSYNNMIVCCWYYYYCGNFVSLLTPAEYKLIALCTLANRD